MATKDKGIVDQAMKSKPVVATKDAISKAVVVVADAFMDPPLAIVPTKKAKRAPQRKATKKMDRKLVSTMEDYEIKYLAQKHSVTQKAVKAAVAKVGHSRNKVEAELKRGKA